MADYTDEMKRANGRFSGGYIKNIPKPHIRQWPGHPTKRRIRVQILQYALAGGRHYRADIKEEDNPIWNRLTHAEANPKWEKIQGTEYGNTVIGWQMSWDDEEGKGRQFFSEAFKRWDQAVEWVRDIIDNKFDGDYQINSFSEELMKVLKWGGYLVEGD